MFYLSIEKERLLKSLLLVIGATAERKPNMPILAHVLMIRDEQKLTFIGTDTEIEIVVPCPLEVSPKEEEDMPSSVTVPAKKMVDICRSLPDKAILSLREQGEKLLIQSGNSRFSLVTLPVGNFPKIKEEKNGETFSIHAQDLKYLLQSTSFAMAQEDIRTYLNGVLLEKKGAQLIAAAMDGHRLAVCKMEMEKANSEISFRIVLPRKGIVELIKLLDLTGEGKVTIRISENHFFVGGTFYTFVTHLLNCSYPQYSAILPKQINQTIQLEREVLKQILSRVAVLANEKKRSVHFDVQKTVLKVALNNAEQEIGEDEMPITLEGEPFEINFNINYIMDVLNSLPSIEIKLSCARPEMGILFESAVVPQVQYLVMPIKV